MYCESVFFRERSVQIFTSGRKPYSPTPTEGVSEKRCQKKPTQHLLFVREREGEREEGGRERAHAGSPQRCMDPDLVVRIRKRNEVYEKEFGSAMASAPWTKEPYVFSLPPLSPSLSLIYPPSSLIKYNIPTKTHISQATLIIPLSLHIRAHLLSVQVIGDLGDYVCLYPCVYNKRLKERERENKTDFVSVAMLCL